MAKRLRRSPPALAALLAAAAAQPGTAEPPPARNLRNPDHLAFVLDSEQWNCDTEDVNWGRWPLQRKAWCCQHKGTACPPSGPHFDCAGEERWESWAWEKQSWCCKVRGIACNASPSTVTVTSTITTQNPILAALSCSERDVSYMPLDMPGHTLVRKSDLAECQALCKGTWGCAHYVFYPALLNCHLSGPHARQLRTVGTISGPPECETTVLVKFSKGFIPGLEKYVHWGALLCCAASLAGLGCFLFAARRHAARARALLAAEDSDSEQSNMGPKLWAHEADEHGS